MTNEQESEEVRRFKETKIEAEQGDAEAEFRLSQMYERGEGVPPNYAEALKWSAKARKTAEEGDAETQFKMGVRYHKMKDYDKAEKWYEMAAEQGLAKAQGKLGRMYANGEGVSQDYDKAAKWLWKAMQGKNEKSPQSMIGVGLGVMYFEGKGVPQDYVETYAWFLLAKANGVEEVSKMIFALEKLLTAEQIKKGQARALERRRFVADR